MPILAGFQGWAEAEVLQALLSMEEGGKLNSIALFAPTAVSAWETRRKDGKIESLSLEWVSLPGTIDH